MLPPLIGVIATVLFFMERDNNTFKNIKTIPITINQMIFAKCTILFLISVLYSVISTLVLFLVSGIGTGIEAYGILYKIILSIQIGIFVTAGTMPLILLINFISSNFIFSVLLCIFYSIVNTSVLSLYPVLPKWILWILPGPLVTFWSGGDMVKHGMKLNLTELQMRNLIPNTMEVVILLGITVILSFFMINFLYGRRSE